MSKLHANEVSIGLNRALATSRRWAKTTGKKKNGEPISNSDRSARFLSDACKEIDQLINPGGELCPRFVCVDDAGTRHPGEWLLDGVWWETTSVDDGMNDGVPIKVHCAIECESQTSGREFFKDLGKLLVVSSDIKIFAAGISQLTPAGADTYVRTRVSQVERLLNKAGRAEGTTDWYLAFWPSPLAVNEKSLWSHLDSGSFAHLSVIRLYHRSSRPTRRSGRHQQAGRSLSIIKEMSP